MRRRQRKAVASMIATVLLIVITIGIGLLVYSMTSGLVGSLFSTTSVEITSSQLIKTTSGLTTFAITLKNEGTTAVSNISVTVGTSAQITSFTYNSRLISSSNPLPPGGSASYASSSITGSFVIGETYPILLTATAQDGSSYSTVSSISCASS